MSKPFIGLASLVISAPTDTTKYSGESAISTNITPTAVHENSFQYSEDDPTVTDYIDEFTGEPYYSDVERMGTAQITADAAYIAEVLGVHRTPKYGKVVGTTKTGATITFDNALIYAKGNMQNKNVTGQLVCRCIGSPDFDETPG